MLKGSFELIGDKSISHRAIMFSSISKGKNKISNFLMGEDCLSTVNCFRKMGVDIEINNNEVYVSGKGLRGLKSLEDKNSKVSSVIKVAFVVRLNVSSLPALCSLA